MTKREIELRYDIVLTSRGALRKAGREEGRRIRMTMTPGDARLVMHAGLDRTLESIDLNLQPRFGEPRATRFLRDWVGECGEFLCSRYLDIHWSGKGTLGTGDLSHHVEVKTTTWATGHLVVSGDEPTDTRFVLVVGTSQNFAFDLVGWIGDDDARAKTILQDLARPDYPARTIDQDELWPMSTLRRMIAVDKLTATRDDDEPRDARA